jgi:hypothetical protein
MSQSFQQNEYIVILELGNYQAYAFQCNYVYKQRCEADYLRVYKDSEGDENGTSRVPKSNSRTWRYATPEEIRAYDLVNQPVPAISGTTNEITNYEIY